MSSKISEKLFYVAKDLELRAGYSAPDSVDQKTLLDNRNILEDLAKNFSGSGTDEIVEVKNAPLLIKGGDRDVVVRLSDLEYCITAIVKLQAHKASFLLEQIIRRLS